MNAPQVVYKTRAGKFTDIEAVKARVRLSEWVGKQVLLKRDGQEFLGLCPFHQEKSPSFRVNDQKGFYHCFGCQAHGDIFEWLKQIEHMTFAQALSALRGFFSMPENVPSRPKVAEATPEKPKDTSWLARDWTQARPSDGSIVMAYLAARGIAVSQLPARVFLYLRFEPAAFHRETGLKLPAMLGRISSVDGALIGLHRTYLAAENGRVKKAKVVPAKRMVGSVSGGAIQLFAPGSVLAIAEGIETALSVWQATKLPIWPVLSLGNLSSVKLPCSVREVILCRDNDSKDKASAEAQVQQAAAIHAGQGRRVRIATPRAGTDFNDMLMEKA